MNVSRIAYVCNDRGIPLYGTAGSSVHIREFVSALSSYDVNPIVLYRTRNGSSDRDSFPGETTRLPQVPFSRGPLNKVVDVQSVAKNYELLLALRRICDEVDLIHERYSLFSYKGAQFAQKHDLPFFLEVNAPLVYETSKYYGPLRREAFAERAERQVCENATGVFVVSQELKEYFANYVNESKITVVPNGVNPEQFSPDVPATVPSDRFTIGFVGSFKRWHGIANLVEAGRYLSKLRDRVRFLFVGTGPLSDHLRSEIADSDLEDLFELPGSVPHSEIPGYLSSIDIAVAPYPDLSFFYYSPLKLFEYMSMGLPTVGSAIGQVKRVIDDGDNGFLVPPGDIDALAETLRQVYCLYRDEPGLFETIGTRARETVLNGYTWDQNAQQICEVYESAL